MKKNSSSIAARATLGALFLIVSVVLVLFAVGKEQSGTVPAVSVLPPSGILFSHNTIVDFSATSGEPFINAAPVTVPPNTPAGSPFISVPFGLSTTISLLWKSPDGGRSFIQLGTPLARDAVPGPGGGDTHQDFDAVGRFYYSDLAGACVTTGVSDDGGNTFPKTSPATCIGVGDLTGVTDDRQWSGAFGGASLANPADPASRGYMTARNLAVSVGANFHLVRTRDAGATWLAAQPIGTVTQSGPLVVDKTKRNIGGTDYIVAYQIYYTGGTLKMLRIQDPDNGNPVTAVDLTIITPGGSVATVFPVAAVDRAGNLYVTWSDQTQIRMVTSQNFGLNWTTVPTVVSGPAAPAAKIMPWVIAGDSGRANVVWYQSTEGLGNAVTNRWDIYMAQTLNAFDGSPVFQVAKVNEHTIHFGEICLAGLNCDVAVPPGSRDRSFLEFPSITLDHRGAAMITWNDNTNQAAVTAAAPQVTGAPYVMFSKQLCGPSLFANVGSVGESGPVAITSPASGATVTAPVTVRGTHSLPPETFDRDESGDGKFPDHGPAIGANVPALDIRQVDITDTAANLIVRMQVADATTAALASATGTGGGDGLLYLVQWDYDESVADPIDKVFWVAAEIRAGIPVGRTGTLGVVRSATSKKFITYNPDAQDSLQVTVAVTNTAPGTITLTIPRNLVGNPPNGALLKSVTGYAMSERGPLTPFVCPEPPASCENAFNPTSLPLRVDTAGAFTYVVGGGLQLDGLIELSLDDPNFSSPTPASASLDGTWQGTFTPGAGGHTVYARQVVRGGCATSPTVSVPFTIEGQNNPPIAVLTANPTSGNPPLTVTFDATGSTDPDFSDTINTFTFNFGDGSPEESGGSPVVQHTYTSAGTFVATLVVTDSRGATSQNTAQQVITVTAPTPTPTPTATPTATPVATPTATPSATPSATPTATPIATPSATPTATPVASPSATPSATPTATPVGTPTATPVASPTATPVATPSATPVASPTPTPSASPIASPTATPTATPTPTPGPSPVNVQLLNISGRVFTQSGDKVGIGGFIIAGTGSGTKRIMARAIGPSMTVNGTPVQGRLENPFLELHDNAGSPPLINDNWRDSQQAEIQQSGLAPSDDRESAVIKRLPAGNYTAIIRGADGSPGIGLVELYDLSSTEPGELGNLSVRADVGTDDNVLIDGLILRGGTPKRVLFRALGPSVRSNGAPIPGALQNPSMELFDQNGTLLRDNDDWQNAPNATEIQTTGLAPPDDREAAILLTLPPGNYTAVVRGVNRTTGIGLAEAYKLEN